MENKIFVIENLGIFEFVVSLVTFDYPEVFVARRISNKNNCADLFIFDEIESTDDSVSWAATQLSFEQFGLLNKGRIRLDSCFYGDRGSPKKGYKITSKSGLEKATKIDVDDISSIINHELDYYVDQFVEDNHGIDALQLATGEKIVGVILDENERASPFINGSVVKDIINANSNFIKSLPYDLDTTRYNFAMNQSVVVCFGLTNKGKSDPTKINLTEEEDANNKKMVNDAIDLIQKALSPETSEGELLSSFSGQPEPIRKIKRVVNAIKKANPQGNTIVTFSSNKSEPSFQRIIINKNAEEIIKTRSNSALKTIEEGPKSTNTINATGTFKMFDGTKNNGAFVFRDEVTKTDYKGISHIEIKSFEKEELVMELFRRRYRAKITELIYSYGCNKSKSVFELEEIEPDDSQEQLDLFK